MNQKISSKQEFISLASSGVLGNQMPSWSSVEEALRSGHRDLVMIRSMIPNSPYMRPDVPIMDAQKTIDNLVLSGALRDSLYLTWMSPSVGRRLNAEVWRGSQGVYLHYSTVQTHLRAALESSGRHAERSAALAILRWALCPNSYDDLMIILDTYPDASIELTAFDREIGTVPGRNTIFWEVRNY